MEKNPSIQCQVDECKYHSVNEDYCTLNNIMVGKSGQTATSKESTDCNSFDVKERTF